MRDLEQPPSASRWNADTHPARLHATLVKKNGCLAIHHVTRVSRRMAHVPRCLAAAVSLAAVLAVSAPAWVAAHEKKKVGDLQLVVGWSDEPVFSGSRNAVEVRVSDAAGTPVLDPDASLSVEVAFGDERITLPLRRTREPGRFEAWLLPNRPGTYTFHITGTVKTHAIDTTSTCSESTFDCVSDVASIQFPAKDPPVGQLADRVTRDLARGERAVDAAARARVMSTAALAIAGAALLAACAVWLTRRRQTA